MLNTETKGTYHNDRTGYPAEHTGIFFRNVAYSRYDVSSKVF